MKLCLKRRKHPLQYYSPTLLCRVHRWSRHCWGSSGIQCFTLLLITESIFKNSASFLTSSDLNRSSTRGITKKFKYFWRISEKPAIKVLNPPPKQHKNPKNHWKSMHLSMAMTKLCHFRCHFLSHARWLYPSKTSKHWNYNKLMALIVTTDRITYHNLYNP